MSLLEIIKHAKTPQELNEGASRALQTANYNIPGSSFLQEEPADLSEFTNHKQPDNGLRTKEAYGLFSALNELTLNIYWGLGAKPKIVRTDSFNRTLNAAFSRAQESHPQPYVEFGIKLDTETGRGEVFTTHPVVPGFSPEAFDINASVVRRKKGERMGGLGGIENIEERTIHRMLTDGGLPLKSKNPRFGGRSRSKSQKSLG